MLLTQPFSRIGSFAGLALLSISAPTEALDFDAHVAPETLVARRSCDCLGEATVNVLASAKALSDEYDLGFAPGISVLGALLEKGAYSRFERTLTAGVTYVLIGEGCAAVIDLDLDLLDAEGNIVAEDKENDAAPAVVFTPPTTGKYTIRATLYDSTVSDGFVVVALLSDDGWTLPLTSLGQATGRVIKSANTVSNDDPCFMCKPNSWCLYGSVIRPGGEASIVNIGLSAGSYGFLAACDNGSKDIDVYVSSPSGAERSDVAKDAFPKVLGQFVEGSYKFRMKNVEGQGTSLVLGVVLKT